MNNLTKFLLVICFLGAVFSGGYYLGSGNGKQSEKLVYKDKIVTVTKIVKPDGTVISETKTENKTGTTTVSKPILPNYSLSVYAVKPLELRTITKKPDLGLGAGYRLIGNIWAELLVIPAQQTAALGVSLKF